MKAASIIAIALVLATVAMPATAACCSGKTAIRMAAMHVTMPCCNSHCNLVAPSAAPETNVVLTTTVNPAPAIVATMAPAVAAATALDFAAAEPALFSSPPTFLAHHQFRI